MSTTVDQRVVEMRFDNKQFESNVADTMSTVDKLKQKLNLTGAAKGLEEVNTAARRVDLAPLSNAAEVVATKFSYMQMTIQHQLNRIVDSAVNTGKRMISALTIDPVKTGFSEYETKMGSIQTIMSNTASKGTTMDDVTRVIGELNTYADKTIYNFAEMTRNIGTFTAAGIGLEESATAIQGIANLAAVSGSNSQQASTAMYQLSQALASGTVKLMDWNSVVNAGMGGQVFQDALKESSRKMAENAKNLKKMTADQRKAYQEAHGYTDEQIKSMMDYGFNVDQLIEKSGSFRESLSQGWITSDVLTMTLQKMTRSGAAEYLADLTGVELEQITAAQKLVDECKDGSASYEELAEQLASTGKVTKEEALNILTMADNAENAATKVKTFTQLWDTLKESAQSGWSQTWEILVGDFEEAKEMFTMVSDVIGGMISESADARNKILQGWKDEGGRLGMIEGIANAFHGVMNIINPIKEAFREIFPPVTVEQLISFTKHFKALTSRFKEFTASHGDQIKATFKGIFAAIDIGVTFVKELVGGISRLIKNFKGLGGGILDVTGSFGDWISGIRDSVHETDIFGTIIDGIVSVLSKVITAVKTFAQGLKAKLSSPGWEGFLSLLNGIWGFIQKIGEKIGQVGSKIGEALSAAFRSGDLNTGVELLNGGLIAGILFGIKGFVDDLKDVVSDGDGIIGALGDIKDAVLDTFGALQAKLQSEVLLKIASAIAILAVSLLLLALINPERLSNALMAISVLFVELIASLKSITKMGDLGGVSKSIGAMIAISVAVLILAAALKTISSMNMDEMITGLVGVGALMAALVIAVKQLSKDGKNIAKGAGQMILMAVALKILASVCKDLGALSPEELIKGVLGVSALLAAFAGFQALMKKIKPEKMLSSALALLLVGAAMEIFADVCTKFGGVGWDALAKAGAAMGGVLVFAAGLAAIGSFIGGILTSSIALVIMGAAMEIFADVCTKFGGVEWGGLAKAGAAMLGILIFAAGLAAVGMMTAGVLAGSAALVIMGVAMELFADVCTKFSSVEWGGLAKAGVAMLGILVFALGVAALGLLSAPIALGSVALLVMGVAMEIFAGVCATFAMIDWGGLAKAGVAIAGILLLAAGFGVLASFAPGMIVGAAALLVIAAALAIFTPVLVTLGAMSWEAIGKGLVAIAGAFIILGLAGLLIGPLAPAILALSASLLIFGVACVAIGAGITLLAIGFTMLATAGSAGAVAVVSALTIIVTGIASLIPVVCQKLGEGVVAFAGAIASGAIAIAEAVVLILVCILNTVNENIGTITEAAVQIIAGFVQGVADNIQSVVDAAADLIVNFINGITGALPDIVEAATNLISEFIASITSAITTLLPDLVTAGEEILGAVFDGIVQAVSAVAEGLGEVIGSFVGGILSGITESVADVDVSTITDKASEFFDAAGSLVENVKLGLEAGATGIDTASAALATGAVTAMKGKEADFSMVATAFATKLEQGLTGHRGAVNTAGSTLAGSAVSGVRSRYTDMYTAGGYVAQGLINGMYVYKNAVYLKGKELGKAAVDGVGEGIDQGSPSRITYQSGLWTGEGLINGMDEMGSYVHKSGVSMGKDAVDGVAEAISGISDIIDSDMDTQPTIRPIVDLSDASAGAKLLNSMFNDAPSMGVNAHLRSINSMMRGQNGANDDVVSAIDRLGRKIDNMPSSTYTINGITYDDGSNITDAVRTLVRAARLERRV